MKFNFNAAFFSVTAVVLLGSILIAGVSSVTAIKVGLFPALNGFGGKGATKDDSLSPADGSSSSGELLQADSDTDSDLSAPESSAVHRRSLVRRHVEKRGSTDNEQLKATKENYRKALKKVKKLRKKLMMMDPTEKARHEDFRKRIAEAMAQQYKVLQDQARKDQEQEASARKASVPAPTHHMVVRLELPPEVADAVESAKKFDIFKQRFGDI